MIHDDEKKKQQLLELIGELYGAAEDVLIIATGNESIEILSTCVEEDAFQMVRAAHVLFLTVQEKAGKRDDLH